MLLLLTSGQTPTGSGWWRPATESRLEIVSRRPALTFSASAAWHASERTSAALRATCSLCQVAEASQALKTVGAVGSNL
jgi:hypothetical protein